MEIRFHIQKKHRNRKYSEYHNFIITRIAKIVVGNDFEITPKENGYRYQLDRGNNWWMDQDKVTGEFILAYRYGQPKKMEALRTTIIWLLRLEEWNP